MTLALAIEPRRDIHILIVEDNDASRQLTCDYLRYCGYQVFSISGGEGFDAAMKQFKPDLVLLDLKLPGVDGFAILQERQKCPEWMKIPLIVVSAYAFQADQQRAFSLGADRYIVKPVKLQQLRQAITETLKQLAA